MSEELTNAEHDMDAATQCLFIAVEQSVASDVFGKWLAYKDAVRATIRQQADALAFVGATLVKDGGVQLDMMKYHAAHRCERHRDDPWQGIDTEIDCFVCLKQQHGQQAERIKELEERCQVDRIIACLGGDFTEQLSQQVMIAQDKIVRLEAELARLKG